MQMTEDVKRAIEGVIRERLGAKVQRIVFVAPDDDTEDGAFLIEVQMSSDVTDRDFAGRFFGLTGRVRSAMGKDLRDVFPVIRPVEAHA